jgi:hypothetical protein
VVFQPGPSAVITLNFASGRRSPTLMAMVILWGWWLNRMVGGFATKLRGHGRSPEELPVPQAHRR